MVDGLGVYELVFVYGLLRYGFGLNRKHLSLKQLVGVGYVRGFNIVDLGGYPGAVRGSGIVWGEVYRVPAARLLEMDEDEPGYQRKRVKVYMDPLGHLEAPPTVYAYMYVWGERVYSCPISGGDFVEYMGLEPVVLLFDYCSLIDKSSILGGEFHSYKSRVPGYTYSGHGCGVSACATLERSDEEEEALEGYVRIVRRSAIFTLEERGCKGFVVRAESDLGEVYPLIFTLKK